MKIPLDEFEQVIDDTILKRGLSYYKKGYVHDLEEVAPGCYETIVEGSDNYTVQLTVKKGTVTDYSCDCPYADGPVCKHVAAAIFKLQEDSLNLTTTKKESKPRGKNAATQIKEMLAKATKEELEQFLIDESKKNADLRLHIISAFDKYNDSITSANYKTIIKGLVIKAADRYGFIDWSDSNRLGKEIAQMLTNSQKHLDSQNYGKVLPIAFAVIEELQEPLNNSDDSSGSIGDCISIAVNLLRQTAEQCPQSEIRRSIFDTCIGYFNKKYYEGFNWDIDFISIAASLVDNNDDFQTVTKLLDKPQDSKYTAQNLQTIKYNLLKKVKGDAEAEKFLSANLSNPDLRRKSIELAIKSNDFDKAIKLAKDGIKKDEKNAPGYVVNWYEYLLKIAQKQHDTPQIIEYAQWLLHNNYNPSQDYYKILKKSAESQEWPQFFENLIRDIKNRHRYDYIYQIANIYVREKMWDRLFSFIKENRNLSLVEDYEKHLAANYSSELADIYAEMVLQYMVNNVNRSAYQEACRYIRHIKKLGSDDKAYKVIETLKSLYPKRRALQEELEMV